MALRYYPLSRIKTNLYTKGDTYVLPDGKPYTGRYYKTFDNKAYAGANPIVGTNEPLTLAENRVIRDKIINRRALTIVDTYNSLTQEEDESLRLFEERNTLQELVPYFPIPLESDYQRGYFTRYFAKTVTGPGYIIEISPADFQYLENGFISPNTLGYEFIDMFWQLTGPLQDTRISQYQIKGGVESTNRRVTETKEKSFTGIMAFIGGNYTKFARIT